MSGYKMIEGKNSTNSPMLDLCVLGGPFMHSIYIQFVPSEVRSNNQNVRLGINSDWNRIGKNKVEKVEAIIENNYVVFRTRSSLLSNKP